MAQKLKPNTRIPTISQAKLLKSAVSTFNLNSGNRNIGFKSTNTKPPPVTRATHLRRSKSVTDLSSLRTRPLVAFNKQPEIANPVRRPIKRTALTETNSVLNKISKVVSKPETSKPATKPIQQKIAPYDYKGRFNQLKEKHEKLKTDFRDLKVKHETTADQNEDLLSKTTQLQTDFDSLQFIYEELKKAHTNLVNQHAAAASCIETLQTKSDKLETDLKENTVALNFTTKELKEIKEIYNKVQTKLTLSEEQLQETLKSNAFMKTELHTLQVEKRKMHNQIQELKGNIRVFCRIRPILTDEIHKVLYDVNYLDETKIELYRTKDKKNEFSFDKVFGPSSSQTAIFEELSQLVQSALDGYNVCVFAYGQTGSGKTYTMEGGDGATRGMIPRSIDTIFSSLESLNRLGWTYKIKASFLEIYNENVVDLLDPTKTNLEIRMCDAKGTDVYVTNLTIEDIPSADKLKKLMKIAQRNRAVAATENNERSSRSHSVTKISLEGHNEEQGQKCIGNLNLIDLAGSEKFHTTETTRLRETTNINKSLSNLGNVILCLVNKSNHVPYRNSKLTHLLMPSLGGNSKTLMLTNISPLEECFSESVNSLRFASTVNQCKTGAIKKQKIQT